MTQFLHYSGIALWIILSTWLLLRLIFGKNWALKVGTRTFFGPGLVQSTKQLIQETKKRDIKEDTVAEVAAHVVWRLTRIGFFALLLGLIPFILLYQQNRLISKQNELFEYQNERVEKQTQLLESQDSSFKLQNQLLANQNNKIDTQTSYMGIQNELVGYQNTRIDRQIGLMDFQNNLLNTQNYRLNLQNNLIEAERRGALVILMSNIMDQMNEEINKQKENPDFNDSLGYALSDPLIGRIAALSQGFLPYRYLRGDTLTDKVYSPERGQLLLSLVKSNLDSNSYLKLYEAAEFSNAYLVEANLSGAYLVRAKLNGADLSGANLFRANLRGADFFKANFTRAILNKTSFTEASLTGAAFFDANLMGTSFTDANLAGADLLEANLFGVNFLRANLEGANLAGAKLGKVNLRQAELAGANLEGSFLNGTDLNKTLSLTKEQLIKARKLIEVKNLDPALKQAIIEEKPCLFTNEGCE